MTRYLYGTSRIQLTIQEGWRIPSSGHMPLPPLVTVIQGGKMPPGPRQYSAHRILVHLDYGGDLSVAVTLLPQKKAEAVTGRKPGQAI